MPLERVYLAITRWALEALDDTRMLDLAAFSSTSPVDTAFPSWVPDFRKLTNFPRSNKSGGLLNLKRNLAATRSSTRSFQVMPDNVTLQLSGMVIDKLEYVSAELPFAHRSIFNEP